MTEPFRPPHFDDLIDADVPADERARLRRVHDLLVAAGPPPDVPKALSSAPRVVPMWRRRVPALALAAALAVGAFVGGYATANRGEAFEARDVVALEPTPRGEAVEASVRLGTRDEAGNWSMQVTVEGLRHLPKGDYYEVFWVDEEGHKITCGTFNVGGPEQHTVTFNVAYSLDAVRGWELSLYRAEGHKEVPLARA